MAIIVFQHSPRMGPGRLGLTLRDHSFKLDIRRLDLPPGPDNKGVPPDFDNVEGILSLGGEPNVGDDHPWMEPELAYLREAHERQIPLVGICLGAQMIAHALGGQVGPCETPEWGMLPVGVLPAGQTETILSGIPWSTPQFQSHNQEVKQLPPGAVQLAGSERSRIQVFRAGLRTYGFQFHFECDRAQIESFVVDGRLGPAGIGPTQQELAAQLDEHYALFARAADRLSLNIAQYVFPLTYRAAPHRIAKLGA